MAAKYGLDAASFGRNVTEGVGVDDAQKNRVREGDTVAFTRELSPREQAPGGPSHVTTSGTVVGFEKDADGTRVPVVETPGFKPVLDAHGHPVATDAPVRMRLNDWQENPGVKIEPRERVAPTAAGVAAGAAAEHADHGPALAAARVGRYGPDI